MFALAVPDAYLDGMSTDYFSRKIRCPSCGVQGIAELSEEGSGWSYMSNPHTTVEKSPDGFAPLYTEARKLEFTCTACGTVAEIVR